MAIKIEVGNGPDELARGKEALAEQLRLAWQTLPQDSSASPSIIHFRFGDRESWFRVSRSASGEPLVGYADKDHLAILYSHKEVVKEFLAEACPPRGVTPFVLKQHYYDIDEQIRIERTFSSASYPPDSPRVRLETEQPAKMIDQQQLPLPFELEPAEKGAGRLGLFHRAENESGVRPGVKPVEPDVKNKGPTSAG